VRLLCAGTRNGWTIRSTDPGKRRDKTEGYMNVLFVEGIARPQRSLHKIKMDIDELLVTRDTSIMSSTTQAQHQHQNHSKNAL
jgi:hypothetical protein